jgi:hypothetical protein
VIPAPHETGPDWKYHRHRPTGTMQHTPILVMGGALALQQYIIQLEIAQTGSSCSEKLLPRCLDAQNTLLVQLSPHPPIAHRTKAHTLKHRPPNQRKHANNISYVPRQEHSIKQEHSTPAPQHAKTGASLNQCQAPRHRNRRGVQAGPTATHDT